MCDTVRLILRSSLFLSCAQDIAKLATDTDKRTPSISNLITTISDAGVELALREAFASWHAPLVEQESDPEIIEAIRLMHLDEEQRQRAQFDATLLRVHSNWAQFSSSSSLAALQTIRDRVTAHTEVRYVADKYCLVDIGQLGLKWSELRPAIDQMQGLVADLGLIIRNAGFAWEMLDAQLARASKAFWLPDATAA